MAVEHDAAAGVGHEEVEPSHAAGRQAHPLRAGGEPLAVDAVVGLLDVQHQHDAGLVGRFQVLHQALGHEHVVGDGAAPEKGRLGRRHPQVERPLKAVREHPLRQLEVGVQESDGAVGGEPVPRQALALLVDGQDDALGPVRRRRLWQGEEVVQRSH